MNVANKFVEMFTSVPQEHMWLIVFIALCLAMILTYNVESDED